MKKLQKNTDFSLITKESGEPSPVKGKKPAAAKPKSRKSSAKPSAGKVKGKRNRDMSDDEVLGSDDSLNDFIVGDDEEVKKKRR